MFIELVDLLRCPRDHEDSWLVAAIHERAGRDIVRGVLGCPICTAAYPIENGVAIFGRGIPSAQDHARGAYDESSDDLAMRCAALLDLFEPGGAVILGGTWARAARGLLEIARTGILLVAPQPSVPPGSTLSTIEISDGFPVAAGSIRGIALDERTCSASLLASAVHALKPGGRLVAPVSAKMPPGVIERARDDALWVAETDPASGTLVPLTVQRTR
jgi:uncharacterized protein YbaR (Trm112 family)